ncbi:MAG TPA: hypothetical protein VHX65_19490 [Pirellulales bacterium]|jgi:hypothetical protein|nr:hypothetical protein [Pirellulales bacterium]
MNRIVLLILGLSSGLWALRDLGSVNRPTASLRAAETISTDHKPTDEKKEARSLSPAIMPGCLDIASEGRAIRSETSGIVKAVKYTVLVQDAENDSDEDMLELAEPKDKSSEADRAALGRWATSLIDTLVHEPGAAAKAAMHEDHPLGKLAAQAIVPPPKHESATAPQAIPAAPPIEVLATDIPANTEGSDTENGGAESAADVPTAKPAETTTEKAVEKIAESLSEQSNEKPSDMERPAVAAALPEEGCGTDESSVEPHGPARHKSAAPAPAAIMPPVNPVTKPSAKSPVEKPHDTAAAVAPSPVATRAPSSPVTLVAPMAMPHPIAGQPIVSAAPIERPFSPQMIELSQKIRYALAMYQHQRLLNTGSNACWEVMHRFVAFGAATEVLRDGPGGEPVNAIGWLLWGGRCNSQPLLVLSDGRPMAMVGVGVQGHPGQFLGMLAQSRVRPDSPFQLGSHSFTVQDLIDQEKLDCDSNIELTFELIAMSYYQKTDDSWTSRNGEQWSISRLVQEEIRQPINGAACGGSHRLFGLSAAFKKRMLEGKPVDGEFLRAKKYVRAYQSYTLGTIQNRDGSFSTDWFRRPADNGDLDRKIQTTGHILEWLVFSLDDSQLRDPRIIRSVDFLSTQIIMHPNKAWSVGPFGHALHAIALYQSRVFTPSDPQFLQPPAVVAQAPLQATPRPVAAQPAPKPLTRLETTAPATGPAKPVVKSPTESRPRQTSVPPDAMADPMRPIESPVVRPVPRPSVGTPNAASATAELEGPSLGVTR